MAVVDMLLLHCHHVTEIPVHNH